MIRRFAPRGDAGQSLVEFAILLPILMGVVVGIFEFGRAWNIDQVVTNAAREGARLAVVPTTTSDNQVQAAVKTVLTDAALDPSVANIRIKGFGDGYGMPTEVEVRYPYQFTFLGPVMRLMGVGDGPTPGAIMLTSRITMRNE